MKEKHEPIDFRNHRYSSIDMARETGMSSEGLRFYERKGILQVDKDEKNGNRTYPLGQNIGHIRHFTGQRGRNHSGS